MPQPVLKYLSGVLAALYYLVYVYQRLAGLAVYDGARERQEEVLACRSRVFEHGSPAELFIAGRGALLKYAQCVSY